MKRNFTCASLAVLLTAFLFSSCTKKEDAPAFLSPQISFALNTDNSLNIQTFGSTASSGNGLMVGTTLTNASVTFTSGVANIAAFKLEAKRNNMKIEITTKNLTNVDLFGLNQLLATVPIDTGTYKEIEIKAVLAKTTTTNLPLVLKGYFTTKGGTQVPLEFNFNDNAVLRAEVENIHLDGKKDLATTISLHLNKLLANITAADIDHTTRINNTILISSTVNVDLYNKILANLASSVGCKGFELHEKSEREKKH